MKKMLMLACIVLFCGCSNIKNLPPNVKNVLLEEFQGIKLKRYSSWTENGKDVFNVVGNKDGKVYTITVDETGKLLNVKIVQY